MNVPVDLIKRLQSQQERIRNFCILAHVDHGKTTLSDHLIGSNALIHPRMAGELRYLDYKEDEQVRGITMKSSSISLLYVPGGATRPEGPKSCSDAEKLERGLLINLIDSPGHVDFCSEVSTAARLSDGALVVVDAVEGVCIQTHAVLRQAYDEKVRPCLIVNKMDRLILELRLSPSEACLRLQQIVTHVNMIWSAFQSEQYMSEADAVLAYEGAKEGAEQEGESADEEEDAAAAVVEEEDTEDMFQPAKGNVAFGSAMDGWACTLGQFAGMAAERLGARPEALQRFLWGDFHYSSKEKRVVRSKRRGAAPLKPCFVQFVLEPLWKAYSACDGSAEEAVNVLGPIVKGRNLQQVTAKALVQPDPRQSLRAVMRAWLPLSEAVLGMAAAHLPSPAEAAPLRAPRLMSSHRSLAAALPEDAALALRAAEDAVGCSSSDPSAPLVVYVSKMVAVPASLLPRAVGDPAPANPNEERFLAFGRVFSGVAREGQRVHVLSAVYDPGDPTAQRQSAVITGIFLMMGRALERLASVPAGNIVAIAGLETSVLKSATLCSSPACRPMVPMVFQAAPIVRVAVEPVLPSEMQALVDGLRLLNRADPFVEIGQLDSGEHVLGAAGEVHLETCIKELKERFAKIQLQVSPPLVAFRESVLDPDEACEGTSWRGSRVVEATTPNGMCSIRVKAHPLAGSVASALDEAAVSGLVQRADHRQQHHISTAGPAGTSAAHGTTTGTTTGGTGTTAGSAAGAELGSKLRVVLREHPKSAALLQRAWLHGPKQVGPNVLLARLPDSISHLFTVPRASVVCLVKGARAGHETANGAEVPPDADAEEGRPVLDVPLGWAGVAERLGLEVEASQQASNGSSFPPGLETVTAGIESGVVAGFQLASSAGPLCDEPMWGIAFEVEVRVQLAAAQQLMEDVYGPFSGQVMTAVNAACRRAVLEADPRLVEAMYLCQVQTSTEGLAGVYTVLGRRRARILKEEMREGSDQFLIHAYLPVEASFGLAGEMRRHSSGAASASLLLSHWERMQVDPFFVPTTEEEREEHGEEAVLANLARRLMDSVRRRKGLPVEEKKVERATKQRTLKRNV